MANKTYQYYKELPSWAKGIVIVGGLTVIYIFASQIIRRTRRLSEGKDAKEAVDSARNELNDLIRKGIKPTISLSQARAYAEKIVKQFKGADLTLGSYDVVYNIFKQLKNNADYLLLKQEFGVRSYDDALWGQVKNVTLESAIQDELTNWRIGNLNAVLEKAGITYRV